MCEALIEVACQQVKTVNSSKPVHVHLCLEAAKSIAVEGILLSRCFCLGKGQRFPCCCSMHLNLLCERPSPIQLNSFCILLSFPNGSIILRPLTCCALASRTLKPS